MNISDKDFLTQRLNKCLNVPTRQRAGINMLLLYMNHTKYRSHILILTHQQYIVTARQSMILCNKQRKYISKLNPFVDLHLREEKYVMLMF